MQTLNVFCNYHQQYGTCTEEDFNDAKEGRNPSNMVRTNFATFTQAVPSHTLTVVEPDKVLPPFVLAMTENEKELRIKEIDKELADIRDLKKKNKVSFEDIEDVSDNYQYNLEWNALIQELNEERELMVMALQFITVKA